MSIHLNRIVHANGAIRLYEQNNMALGFSELGFSEASAADFLTRRFSLNRSSFISLDQVHSTTILNASRIKPDSVGDGIILRSRKLIAFIRTADCTPLFFWHENKTLAGIIHVGWRGLAQGIIDNLLKILKQEDTEKDQFHFFLGPAICGKCYEVGPELLEHFSADLHSPSIFKKTFSGKYFLDVRHAVRLQLVSAGFSKKQISTSEICTFEDPVHFPSYRRQGIASSRIQNFIILL